LHGSFRQISIIEDRLVEMMRKHYYPLANQEYFPISRMKKTTGQLLYYLNLVNSIVKSQVDTLKAAVFEKGSK
jgi:hypothetical protein